MRAHHWASLRLLLNVLKLFVYFSFSSRPPLTKPWLQRTLVLCLGLLWGALALYPIGSVEPQIFAILALLLLMATVGLTLWGWQRTEVLVALAAANERSKVQYKTRAHHRPLHEARLDRDSGGSKAQKNQRFDSAASPSFSGNIPGTGTPPSPN